MTDQKGDYLRRIAVFQFGLNSHITLGNHFQAIILFQPELNLRTEMLKS